MYAHHAAAAGLQESVILGQPATRPGRAVAVGDAVGKVRAHPHFGARIGDDRE